MIRTSSIGPAAQVDQAPRSAASPAGDGAFGKALEQAQGPAAAAPALALGGVNPMLLHEIALSERRGRDREARRRGVALLDALGELQHALLGSEDAGATLDRIVTLLSSMPQADDPALAAIVRSIEVRATVEVCRRRPE